MTRLVVANFFLLHLLLLGSSMTIIPKDSRQPQEPRVNLRLANSPSKSKSFTEPHYFLTQNTDAKRAPVTIAEPWKQTYYIPLYKRSNLDTNDHKKNMYANNIRSFQQLGHYSRSLIRRRQQKEADSRKKQTEASPRTPMTQLPSPAPLFNGLNRHAPLTPMALASEDTRNTPEDNKRTLFLSSGWAPSGLSEVRAEIQSSERDVENPKSAANSYAFTSNHWGPLGKRGLGILSRESCNTEMSKPLEILDIYEDRSGGANEMPELDVEYDNSYDNFGTEEKPAVNFIPDAVNWQFPQQSREPLPLYIEVKSQKINA